MERWSIVWQEITWWNNTEGTKKSTEFTGIIYEETMKIMPSDYEDT